MSITAMKQALEAMEYADACLKKQLTTKTKHEYAQDLLMDAGVALRTAIAEAEKQEPVAWATDLEFDPDTEVIPAKHKGKLGTENVDIALYTTPPAAQRKEAVNAQLLKALEALVDNEDARSWGVFGVDNRSAFTKARAAIKAAKGES